MLHKTNGIVLRTIKYGDSSIITTIFTEVYGVQTYIVQGVRSSKASQNRAGAFQPGTLLELVVYQQPQKNIQRIREFQAAHIYQALHEDVIKNSILLFSVELLLRQLPEHAPMPQLFNFAFEYFIKLDKLPPENTANFPLFFMIQCAGISGYELKGCYSPQTPYLDLKEGGFTNHQSISTHSVSDEDARILSSLLAVAEYESLNGIALNAAIRMRLIDWYVAFLQEHSHLNGNLKSLPVLRAILHQ